MISFVLACRNEYPQATWTVYSLIDDVPPGEEFEVLLMANGNNRENEEWLDWFATKGSLGRDGYLRVIKLDELGMWPAVRRGFKEAKGDVVAGFDAHVAVQQGTIPAMLKLLRKEGGFVHSPVLWMGDYCSNGKWKCYQYQDPIYQGWTFDRLRDTPWTTCGGGLALAMVGREEWFELGEGLEPHMNLVGGGEEYWDLKWWLLGSKVWVHPDALVYHWAYRRNWHRDELEITDIGWSNYHFYNRIIALYCLGGEEWVEKILGEKMNEYQPFREYYRKIKLECLESRKQILDRQIYDGLTGLFSEEPWDYPKKGRDNGVRSY